MENEARNWGSCVGRSLEWAKRVWWLRRGRAEVDLRECSNRLGGGKECDWLVMGSLAMQCQKQGRKCSQGDSWWGKRERNGGNEVRRGFDGVGSEAELF